MVRHRDATLDWAANAQPNRTKLQLGARQLVLIIAKAGARAHEEVRPKALPLDLIAHVLAEVLQPAVDHDRDRRIVEKALAPTYLGLHPTLGGCRECRRFVGDQMQTIVFLAAIGFADARVAGGNEECGDAIAGYPGLRYLRALQAFAVQALDRIAAHSGESADEHRPLAFTGGLWIAWPESARVESRPPEFSGILERAVTIYARNFVRLVGIAGVAIVPVAIVQYIVLVSDQSQLNATLDILQHPEHLRTAHAASLFDSPLTLAAVIAAALFGYYVTAFAFGAIAAGVASLYQGGGIGMRAGYQAALRRWPSIVAIVGCAILALIGAYLATIVIAAIPIFAAAAFGMRWFSSIVTFSIAIVLFLMSFALLSILITAACALCASVIESIPATPALRLTIARVLNRAEFGRALLCAFTVAAVGLVVSTLVDTGAFLLLSRWTAAYEAVDALERVVLVPFLALILAVYYVDVRLRYEGFDLDARRAPAEPPDEPVYAPTAYLTGEERALVKRFLERRDSLAPQRRKEIAAKLAGPARMRVPAELQGLEDEPLLERLG